MNKMLNAKQMKTITLNFKGTETTIQQNKDGLYRLNDLHEASGGEPAKRVNYFAETSKGRISGIISKKGKYGGSYADEKTVYKYAAWIDDEFYDVVFDTFKAAANGKGDQAVQTAKDVVRIQSKQIRKKETSAIKDYQVKQGYYGTQLGRNHFGQVTAITNKLLNLPNGQREFLDADQLVNVMAIDKIVQKTFKQGAELEASYGQILDTIRKRAKAYFELVGI